MNRKQLLAAATAFVMTAAVTVTATAQADQRPRSQILFENVILQYAQEFDRAQNELQESVSRKNRRNAIAALNMGVYIENWVGTIDELGTNTEGKASIKIRLSPNLNIKTWNNALSDMFDNTLIEMDSKLYQVLYNLKKGQRVTFSGNLFRSDDDFYRETSVTIRGAMKDSDFLLRFTDIKPVTNSSSPGQSQQTQRPQQLQPVQPVPAPIANEDYVLPYSSTRELTDDDLRRLTKNELRLARNEIYARYGRVFRDQSLQKYFDSKPWYKNIPKLPLGMDPTLTKLERSNIELIQVYEAR